MKLRHCVIIDRAVEEGVKCGYARAHKHTNAPTETDLCDAIIDAVMQALGEVIVFDEEEIG